MMRIFKKLVHVLIFVAGLFFVGCSNDVGNKERKGDNDKTVQAVATINISSKGEPISKYMYGMFIEPLGNADVGDIVDDGLWAELIDDRKFFYPIDENDKLVPVNKRNNPNQWRPLHTAKAVTMDSLNKYVGVHSPKIAVNGSAEGIAQSGISVVNGKSYVGRLVLSGTPGVAITVSLIWGEGPGERSDFKIGKITGKYGKYPFKMECRGSNERARIEIAATGNGSFSIGAVSLMPSDNINGFRPDVITLLKNLNSSIYRWGGNMSSAFDWRDGIGDPDLRAPRYEYAWEAAESNDVGTHEWIKFAELINVELALTVNAGLGDAFSAAQWVEYVNGSKDTPMGKLRTQNGHSQPWSLKLWCVGNESYGWWQLGHTDIKSYVIKHNMFAEKMRAVDPTIKLIASGASLEEMTITGGAMRTTGKVEAEYDSASDWTGGLLRNSQKNIDIMSEHFYCSVDEQFDISAGKYVKADESLEDWTRKPANRVRSKVENYNEYHKRIPGSKRIPVYIDEWTYFTNWVHPAPTLGVTIGHARGLHEMFRNTDLIKMAGFTFGTSCLSFTDTDAVYNSTGLMFKLYQSQLGTIPVAVEGNSPQPPKKWKGQPLVNAGGDTYPLDMIATLSADQKFLIIAIINPTEVRQAITVQFGDAKVSDKISQWILSGSSSMARNIVGKPAEVTIEEKEIESVGKLTIEKASINIFKYKLL